MRTTQRLNFIIGYLIKHMEPKPKPISKIASTWHQILFNYISKHGPEGLNQLNHKIITSTIKMELCFQGYSINKVNTKDEMFICQIQQNICFHSFNRLRVIPFTIQLTKPYPYQMGFPAKMTSTQSTQC